MGYFNYSQKYTLRHWQTQLEMVAKMAKEESEQTTLIWWDGKQKKLSDFCKELGIEQPKMANKPNKKSG